MYRVRDHVMRATGGTISITYLFAFLGAGPDPRLQQTQAPVLTPHKRVMLMCGYAVPAMNTLYFV